MVSLDRECDDLDPPRNGAVVCNGWAHGRFCIMSCNARYDVPASAVTISPNYEWTCSDTNGVWRPGDRLPDCSGKVYIIYDMN